eukprot:scaffold6800_cov89-Skeletonema_dohrnii-CCMP3373.AAC.1
MSCQSAILAAIESLRDHETGSPISSIRRHILDDTNDNNSDDPSWNEVHFQKTLKTLVEKGDPNQRNQLQILESIFTKTRRGPPSSSRIHRGTNLQDSRGASSCT